MGAVHNVETYSNSKSFPQYFLCFTTNNHSRNFSGSFLSVEKVRRYQIQSFSEADCNLTIFKYSFGNFRLYSSSNQQKWCCCFYFCDVYSICPKLHWFCYPNLDIVPYRWIVNQYLDRWEKFNCLISTYFGWCNLLWLLNKLRWAKNGIGIRWRGKSSINEVKFISKVFIAQFDVKLKFFSWWVKITW